MRWTLSATGPAQPDAVWQRYVRPGEWPSWSPQIRRVDCADDALRAGSTGTVHALFGLSVPFEVTEVDPGRRSWAWRVTLPFGIRLSLRHAVLATATGSRTTLLLDGPAPVVLCYLPLAELALVRLLRA